MTCQACFPLSRYTRLLRRALMQLLKGRCASKKLSLQTILPASQWYVQACSNHMYLEALVHLVLQSVDSNACKQAVSNATAKGNGPPAERGSHSVRSTPGRRFSGALHAHHPLC